MILSSEALDSKSPARLQPSARYARRWRLDAHIKRETERICLGKPVVQILPICLATRPDHPQCN